MSDSVCYPHDICFIFCFALPRQKQGKRLQLPLGKVPKPFSWPWAGLFFCCLRLFDCLTLESSCPISPLDPSCDLNCLLLLKPPSSSVCPLCVSVPHCPCPPVSRIQQLESTSFTTIHNTVVGVGHQWKNGLPQSPSKRLGLSQKRIRGRLELHNYSWNCVCLLCKADVDGLGKWALSYIYMDVVCVFLGWGACGHTVGIDSQAYHCHPVHSTQGPLLTPS